MSDNEHQQVVGHKEVVERLWTTPVFTAMQPLLQDMPGGATVLVAESRCGYIPIQLSSILPEDTRIIALDSSRSMLDQARGRVDDVLSRRMFFIPQRLNSISYADEVFRLCICAHGVITQRQLREGLAELCRVSSPGATILLATPMLTSFPEMYDMFDEALRAHQLHDVLGRLYELKTSFINVATLHDMAEECGLHDARVEEISWEISFKSGQELLMSPLIRETFFPHWIGVIRSSDRDPILRYLADAIDTYWHRESIRCSVHAGLLNAIR